MGSKFFFLLLRFAGSGLPPSHMRGIGIVGRRVRGFFGAAGFSAYRTRGQYRTRGVCVSGYGFGRRLGHRGKL